MIRLVDLIKQKKQEVEPEKIDYGYCIPDCGACCPKASWMTWIIARRIGNQIGVNEDSICSEFKFEGYDGKPCPFLYEPSLCLIRDLEERPHGCNEFECNSYVSIKKINDAGYDISTKLKETWLNQLKGDYNQDRWMVLAKYTIKTANEMIFNKKRLPKELDSVLSEKISSMEKLLGTEVDV